MKFTLTIDMSNALFDPGDPDARRARDACELARILVELADKLSGITRLEPGTPPRRVFDGNGNHVGDWRTTTR